MIESVYAEHYLTEAKHAWVHARRKARQAQFETTLPGESDALLDFNDISHKLHLRHAIDRGVQDVPLDQIVGSVGRYQDFTRAFLPMDDGMGERWQRVAAIYLSPVSGGVPPVELYKVGSSYFVRDGNHRVSVARQLDMVDIEAYVWEYPEPVSGLSPDANIDQLLIEAERQEFLSKTDLDRLRPDHGIRLTAPGGYPIMLDQIERYQIALDRIDGTQTSWETAVTAWYDMIYETTIQPVAESGIVALFPERTLADFFVWVRAYHAQLERRYGRTIRIGDAARDFLKYNQPTLPARTWKAVLHWVAGHLG